MKTQPPTLWPLLPRVEKDNSVNMCVSACMFVRVCETFLGVVGAKEQAELKTDCPELLCLSGANEPLSPCTGLTAVNS